MTPVLLLSALLFAAPPGTPPEASQAKARRPAADPAGAGRGGPQADLQDPIEGAPAAAAGVSGGGQARLRHPQAGADGAGPGGAPSGAVDPRGGAARAGAPAPLLGVLRSLDGPVRSREGGLLVAGQLISVGDGLETGVRGMAEVQLLPDARLRVFPETWVFFDAGPRRLRLLSGRIWLQSIGGRLTVQLGGTEVELTPGSSAILESTQSSGPVALCRAGALTVRERGAAQGQQVPAGHALRVRAHVQAQPGGQAMGALLSEEARRRLGGQAQLANYVLARAVRAPILRSGVRRVGPTRWGDEVDGAGSTAVRLLERGLRPPPFFATEVPPHGPNVILEVGFDED